jgi:hypothetical protein
MTSLLEGKRGVATGLVHQDNWTSRVFIGVLSDVVDPIINDDPDVLLCVVLSYLLPRDHAVCHMLKLLYSNHN